MYFGSIIVPKYERLMDNIASIGMLRFQTLHNNFMQLKMEVAVMLVIC